MTEQMNVPKLRFGEFDTSLDIVPLSKLTTKISDGIHSTPNYDENGDFFFVNGNNLKNGSILLDDKTKRVSAEEAKKHHRQIDESTILMSINGTIGNIAFYQGEPIMLGKSASYINIDSSSADKHFVSNYLQREVTKYYFDTELTGSTIKNLSLKAIKNTPIASPTLPEQQKIASFLSKVDEKIGLLTEKKDKLTEYKKGVMQQLFNGKWGYIDEKDEGQLTFIPPTLRFKADDGSEFPDWEESTVGELVSIKSSKVTPSSDIDLPCIELDNLSQVTGKIIGDLSVGDSRSQKSKFNEGDVLFGKLRPYLRKFAHPNFSGLCSSEIWVMSSKGRLFEEYLFQLIQTESFVSEANKSSGTKMPRADWKVVSAFKIGLPNRAEQTKIANFLSAIDQKIDLTNSELEKANEWKKGLLQQMFV
ncbi:hypothetical protein BCT45_05175 [Vibrio breoganii]|uniref:restriction endonuclease subunit S n=1 Tax=Vibrio breoganii TaxID=553239 RepID=UPI000C8360CE|nr:restriction endonuclease subunit S [Vibrio breoganii]PMM87094.1 hypothetical protein BCT45_05175 [Vibrio breoganii]